MFVVNPQQAVSAPSASAQQPAPSPSPATDVDLGDYSAADIDAAIAAATPHAEVKPAQAKPEATETQEAKPEGQEQAEAKQSEPEANKAPSRAEQRIRQFSAKTATLHTEVLTARQEAEQAKAALEILTQKYQELEAKRNEYDPQDPRIAKLERESLEREWADRQAKIATEHQERIRQAQVEARAEVLKEQVMGEILDAASAHPGVTPQDIALVMSRPDYDGTKKPSVIASEIHKFRMDEFQKLYGKQLAPVAPKPILPVGAAPKRVFSTPDEVADDISRELGPDWFK